MCSITQWQYFAHPQFHRFTYFCFNYMFIEFSETFILHKIIKKQDHSCLQSAFEEIYKCRKDFGENVSKTSQNVSVT